MNAFELAASALTPKSAGGWAAGQMLAPFLSPSLLADSPIFLPLIMVEPSPTTGIQHMIPPLFHSSAARKVLSTKGAVLNNSAPAVTAPCPLEKCAATTSTSHERAESPAAPVVKEESEFSFATARAGKPSAANTDGWQWRKYGEKIVKGSPNPRSYYKCSHAGCLAKKIVERSTQGELLASEYRGDHTHPAPVPKAASRFRPKVAVQGSPPPVEEKVQASEAPFHYGAMLTSDPSAALSLLPIPEALQTGDRSEDREESENGTHPDSQAGGLATVYSFSLPPQESPPAHRQLQEPQHLHALLHAQPSTESPSKRLDALAACAEEAEQELLASGGGKDSLPPGKRRRRNDSGFGAGPGSPPCGREPPPPVPDAAPATASYLPAPELCGGGDGGAGSDASHVVVVDSDKCIDDGYRWRKYGQKQVKGHAFPRSYYKCTSQGCPVRKHVERSAGAANQVVISYEGRHTHSPPCSGGSNNIFRELGAAPQLQLPGRNEGDAGNEADEAAAAAGAGEGDGDGTPLLSVFMDGSPLGRSRRKQRAGPSFGPGQGQGLGLGGSLSRSLTSPAAGVVGGAGAAGRSQSMQPLPPLQQAALSLLPFLQLEDAAPPGPSILNSTLALAANAALGLGNKSSRQEDGRLQSATPWDALASLVLPPATEKLQLQLRQGGPNGGGGQHQHPYQHQYQAPALNW